MTVSVSDLVPHSTLTRFPRQWAQSLFTAILQQAFAVGHLADTVVGDDSDLHKLARVLYDFSPDEAIDCLVAAVLAIDVTDPTLLLIVRVALSLLDASLFHVSVERHDRTMVHRRTASTAADILIEWGLHHQSLHRDQLW